MWPFIFRLEAACLSSTAVARCLRLSDRDTSVMGDPILDSVASPALVPCPVRPSQFSLIGKELSGVSQARFSGRHSANA